MDYIRGDEAEFNAWETLGNAGWNWDTLLPYFKRSENFTIPTAEQVDLGATYVEEYHGKEGYLTTGFPSGLDGTSFYHAYKQAWSEISIPRNPDLDGGHTKGFAVFPQTLDRDANSRESSARAYYEPIDQRSNLKIIQGTVSRITWSESFGESLKATAVEYLDLAGGIHQVGVSNDVVVSAGTMRSPLVLEASGIGNPR